MKETGIRIRLDSKLRDDFVNICRSNDLTAAQVLRAFMRSYIESKSLGKQADLFSGAEFIEGEASLRGKNASLDSKNELRG
jgi:hypothetical protein